MLTHSWGAGDPGLAALRRFLGCLGNRGERINPLRHGYRSRNPARIERVMRPLSLKGMYAWVVANESSPRALLYRGGEYRVERRRMWLRDELSGLRLRLLLLEGYVDGRLVWRTVWTGTKYHVEFVREPDAEVSAGSEGLSVRCTDSKLCLELRGALEKC